MRACALFFKLYWKSLFIMIYPIVILPIFLIHNTVTYRCVYVVTLMAGFWMLEVIPIAITSLFPIVLFPLMGILDTRRTSMNYFHETNMMFVGGLMIALAVEYCNLHRRISLITIRLIGVSYRRLNFGLMTLTSLLSWWISNTAATAMMIPIIKAILEELEGQGVGRMYEEDADENVDPAQRHPTRATMCFFMSIAYSSDLGGLATLVGTGTNMAYKGIFETLFPDSPGVEFNSWIGANAPLSFIILFLTWVWVQTWFMGLFRPNSKDAQAIKIGDEGEKVTNQVLSDKLVEMGRLSTHEFMVAVMFILAIVLWSLKSPGFMQGWAAYITDLKVGDATCAMIVVVLLFVLPARCNFHKICSKDENERPKEASPALITWKFIQEKMHWGLVLLLGGGFALSDGVNSSGMGALIADQLEALNNLPKFAILAISCTLTTMITQFTSNVAMANILLPIAGSVSQRAKIHPMYLMTPICLCCSFSFFFPVSTPPNAIASSACNMRTSEMVKAAIGVELIGLTSLLIVFPTWGRLFWDFDTFPDWAQTNATFNV